MHEKRLLLGWRRVVDSPSEVPSYAPLDVMHSGHSPNTGRTRDSECDADRVGCAPGPLPNDLDAGSPPPFAGRGLLWVLIALVVAATACTGGTETAAPSPPPAAVDPLREIAREQGTVHVIVDLAVEQEADGTWDERVIVMAQKNLLVELGRGATVTARYETTPRLALEVDQRALRRLRASPLVLGIHLDENER